MTHCCCPATLLLGLLLVCHPNLALPLLLPDVTTTPIQRIDLSTFTSISDQTKHIQEHITLRRPVVFTNHANLQHHWPAFSKWTSPHYLSTAFDHLPLPVKVSTSPVFTLYALDAKRGHHESALQGGLEKDQRRYRFQNVTIEDTLYPEQSTSNDAHTDHPYRYYAGPLPSGLATDVQLADLIVPEVSASMSRGIVWMGNQGVTAQLHYDRSFNMFVQVVGQKSFYLFPPTTSFSLFPSFSGSRRQCRYQFPLLDSATCDGDHPRSTAGSSTDDGPAPTATLATLQPGDLLYVPPFYYHTVVSLSPQTISYSVLSPSLEEYYYSSALYAKVNFVALGHPGSRRLRLGAVLYINRILKTLALPFDIFMASLYETRHAVSAGEAGKAEEEVVENKSQCQCKNKIERFKIEKLLGKGPLKEAVKNVTEAFEKIRGVGGEGPFRILLQDYIEELLVFVTVEKEGGEVGSAGTAVEAGVEGQEQKSGERRQTLNRVAQVIRRCWKTTTD